jgi:hypothetical protein
MPRSRRSVSRLLFLAATVSLTGAASATTYTDTSTTTNTTTDVAGGAGAAADIASVVVTNDAFDLHVTINMNPGANLTTNFYAAYEMGIQVGNGAGGQTAINNNFALGDPTAGNPFGNTVGIVRTARPVMRFYMATRRPAVGRTCITRIRIRFDIRPMRLRSHSTSPWPVRDLRRGTPSNSTSGPPLRRATHRDRGHTTLWMQPQRPWV